MRLLFFDLLDLKGEFLFLIFGDFVQRDLPLSVFIHRVRAAHHRLIESLIYILVAVDERVVPVSNSHGGQVFSSNWHQFFVCPSRAFNTII